MADFKSLSMRGEEVKKILEKNGHQLSQVAEKLNISPQNLNNWLGVQDIKTGILEKIAAAINKNMYYFIENQSLKNQNPGNFPNKVIRYYDIDDVTNRGDIFDPLKGVPYKEIIIPGYGDCCLALSVWGKSMQPALLPGDIIICKEWTNIFIEYGNMYLIFTKDNHHMIKYIHPGSDSNKISCVSENEFYFPFEIAKDDILKLFIIKGHIARSAV